MSEREELTLAPWYRRTVHTMTPQTREANRRLLEATLTLTLWSDGERVTKREREDARECLRILDGAEPPAWVAEVLEGCDECARKEN